MDISREEVQHIARLSHLALTDADVSRFQKDLSSVLSYMDALNRLPTDGTLGSAPVMPVIKSLREDTPEPSLQRDALLSNAPATDGEFFLVPKVLDA